MVNVDLSRSELMALHVCLTFIDMVPDIENVKSYQQYKGSITTAMEKIKVAFD